MDPFDSLSNPEYSRFIALSRYARWLPEEKRRETWDETVERYFRFMGEHLEEKYSYKIPKALRKDLRAAVYDLEIMPSMRALMTAGPALARCNVAGFNCSYLPIDHPRAFDELLYILMCGTGVGFSVEEENTRKLPDVNEILENCETTIVVDDSKQGWAKALRQLISLLYVGQIPSWDLSKLRAAGDRLVTFGGRSSGPDPLDDLLKFTVEIFKDAQGRQLTSLECHDICCKIGEVVVVGGVRRSALISLSDIKDIRLRDSKTGEWWRTEPQRSLANNSAVYSRKPDMSLFFDEWHSLFNSKSGERGIFNRDSVKQHLKNHVTRRDPDHPFGCNPCSLHKDTILMTDQGPKKIKDLEDLSFSAVVNGKVHRAAKGSWVSGKKDLWRLLSKDGYALTLTDDHKLRTKDGWKQVKDLGKDETLLLSKPPEKPLEWAGEGGEEHGYLLGAFVGDGNFSQGTNGSQFGQVKVFKRDSAGHEGIYEEIEQAALRAPWKRRSDWNGWGEHKDYYVMNIGCLPFDYGFEYGAKTDIEHLETLTSSSFQKAFLRGLFDADGHFEGTREKSYSVRLGQSSYSLLQTVQRMLLRFGMKSVIRDAAPERKTSMPDGRGGHKEYLCRASWRLIISGKSVEKYFAQIGFSHKGKAAKQSLIEGVRWKEEPWSTKLATVEYYDTQDVWDAEVADVVSFDANGFWAHNSEINLRPYQFCNLTEVVVRPDDKPEDLERKVRLATILGTFQSTLNDFKYLRKIWKKNTEEERLLGVSMTGILDNAQMARLDAKDYMVALKEKALVANKDFAKKLGIEESAAITCVKPSGTVSQLVDSASGIHPRHAPWYIRRVRGDKKDPLSQFMIAQGFPHEDDLFNSHSVVFDFPMASPKSSLTRGQITATDHLELWKAYQVYWCEHKPSATISVREDEWLQVGAWVYENFDHISGVSFLPYEEHTYKQAPYEEITEDEYKELLGKMPKEVNWDGLREYEKEDTTVGSQELACAGGFCEIT